METMSNNEWHGMPLELIKRADQVDDVGTLLEFLQQSFVRAFNVGGVTNDREPSAASLESTEESQLAVAEAVRLFHVQASKRHMKYFSSREYHPHAALFIYELLKCLSGNSQKWFRQLQQLCLSACVAILQSIGYENARLCLPGVASATVRYISRSLRSKDSSSVRVMAIAVLRAALTMSFSSTDGGPWVLEAVGHLGSVMHTVLEPATLARGGYEAETIDGLRKMIIGVLTSPCLSSYMDTVFARQLTVAYAIVESLLHLRRLENVPERVVSKELCEDANATLPGDFFHLVAIQHALLDALQQLRSVELLHVAMTVLRQRGTRHLLIVSPTEGHEPLLSVVMRKCVRVVGTECDEEDMFTFRLTRSPLVLVVDEFLEHVACALAELTEEGEDGALATAGELLTTRLLDDCESVLADWDLYVLHPPVLYVLSRIILWQFRPLPPRLARDFLVGAEEECDRFPSPCEIISSGAFEQLWSVMAQPHLWNIATDEELCTFQQIRHRQVVAAVILRALGLAATSVLSHAVRGGTSQGRRTFERFGVLVLYLVLEKATAAGIVNECAMQCLNAITTASGQEGLDYFLHMCPHVVNEASRAIKVDSLRCAAASVLRGGSMFILSHLQARSGGRLSETACPLGSPSGDTAQLPYVVRHRMARGSVDALRRYHSLDAFRISNIADFISAAVRISADSCHLAKAGSDVGGTKASLMLLQDCFDVATFLNFLTPREAADEDQERQTTSSHPRVKLLQMTVLQAIHDILTHCTNSNATAPFAVQAVLRGLTGFLTTTEAEQWSQKRKEAEAERVAMKESRRQGEVAEEAFCGDDMFQAPVLTSLEWFPSDPESSDGGEIVLPRSHLKTVYRVYLSLVALLQEPISAFITPASTAGRRRAFERRQLAAVPITPAVLAALSGAEALLLLAVEFLADRMVAEVLPLVLVWYERGTLPRISSNSDVRLQKAARHFADFLVSVCPSEMHGRITEKCNGLFDLAVSVSPEDGEASAPKRSDSVLHSPLRSNLCHGDPVGEEAAVSRVEPHGSEQVASNASRSGLCTCAQDDRTSAGEPLPGPSIVSIQLAVQPLQQLLLAFPLPQFSSTTPLCERVVELQTSDGANQVSSWHVSEVSKLIEEMNDSARMLASSGHYTHFMQEALHREAAECSAPPTASARQPDGSNGTLLSWGDCVDMVEAGVSTELKTQLSTAARRTCIECPPSISTPSAPLNWWHGSECRKALLTRKQSSQQTSSQDEPPAAGPPLQAREDSTLPGTAVPRKTVDCDEPHAVTLIDHVCHAPLAEAVEGLDTSLSCAHNLIRTIPLDPQPFRNLTHEKLSAFMVHLMAETHLTKSDCPTSAETDVPSASSSTSTELEASVRGLVCCMCLAHVSFSPKCIPEDLVSSIISTLSALVRCVVRQLGCDLLLGGGAESDDPAGGVDRASGDAAALIARQRLLESAELLRLYFRCFESILCNRNYNMMTETDTARLEDLIFQCLFAVPQQCNKSVLTLYNSYVVDSAVSVYHSVWNHMETQRQLIAERFFPRLVPCEQLLLRFYEFTNGVKCMPLTAVVLAAAQSLPVDPDSIARYTTSRLQMQCNTWATNFLNQFLLAHLADEKAERDTTWAVALQLLEDLTGLLGAPEWPAADVLLRSFIHMYSLMWPNAGELRLPCGTSAPLHWEQLHPLAVDAIANTAFRLLALSVTPLVGVPAAARVSPEGFRVFVESLHVDPALLSDWLSTVKTPILTITEQTGVNGDAQSGHNTQGLPGDALSPAQQLGCVLYNAVTHNMQCTATGGKSSSWLHARASTLCCWLLNDSSPLVPEHAVETLMRRTTTPHSGVDINLEHLRSFGILLGEHMERSVLHSKMRQTLVLMLLSIFRSKDTHQGDAAMPEAVLRKTLSHLAKLTSLHPPLSQLIWPFTRQCIRDDSAKVRESVVPLLQNLLAALCQRDAAPESEVEALVVHIFSSLLHLLEDKSVMVVSRTLSALDALMTDRLYTHFFCTSRGEKMLCFMQSKLLAYASCTTEKRRLIEVGKLFLQRWAVTLMNDTAVTTAAHARIATEMTQLIVSDGLEFPFEVTAEHPLVLVLKNMWGLASSTALWTGKRHGRNGADALQLQHAMKGVATALWSRFQCCISSEDAMSCLAAMEVLAQGSSEWVEPLLESVLQTLVYPPTSDALRDSSPGHVGGTMLHLCNLLRTVLVSFKVPMISLDNVARSLTTLLSTYTGPFQQRIILAACRGLTALITCGTNGNLAHHVNPTYLLVCYSLMNSYYIRLRDLLPVLSNQQNTSYALRFLFLLSEFLRQYAGWKDPHSMLLEDSAAGLGGSAINLLAKGAGICENIYLLVVDLLSICDVVAREKVLAIALRVLSSLCMLQPATYLHKCEPFLRESLDREAKEAHQVQGLTLIRDFITEEDARVEKAAGMTTRICISGAPLAAEPLSDGLELSGKSKRLRRDLTGCTAPTCGTPSIEEQNSGMATWMAQKFHSEVVRLCGSASASIRLLCMEVLQLTVQGGLLPPEKYLVALISLSTDTDTRICRKAAVCLAANADRHEDVIASHTTLGVLRAYDLHCACGVDLIRSAYVGSDSGGIECSVYGPVYRLLHRRSRERFLISLIRLFYQDAGATAWCVEHARLLSDAPKDSAYSSSDVFRKRNVLTFLAHNAMALVTLPFTHVSEVLYVSSQCRTGIDLTGEAMLDALQSSAPFCSQTKKRTHRGMDSNEHSGIPSGNQLSLVELWKCVGVVLLWEVERTLREECNVLSSKQRKHHQNGTHSTSLALRESQSKATWQFFQRVCTFVKNVSYAVTVATEDLTDRTMWTDAYQHLRLALEAALRDQATSTGCSVLGKDSITATQHIRFPKKKRGLQSRVGTAKRPPMKRKRRARSPSSSEENESSPDEETSTDELLLSASDQCASLSEDSSMNEHPNI